jgi:hypothetical protein
MHSTTTPPALPDRPSHSGIHAVAAWLTATGANADPLYDTELGALDDELTWHTGTSCPNVEGDTIIGEWDPRTVRLDNLCTCTGRHLDNSDQIGVGAAAGGLDLWWEHCTRHSHHLNNLNNVTLDELHYLYRSVDEHTSGILDHIVDPVRCELERRRHDIDTAIIATVAAYSFNLTGAQIMRDTRDAATGEVWWGDWLTATPSLAHTILTDPAGTRAHIAEHVPRVVNDTGTPLSGDNGWDTDLIAWAATWNAPWHTELPADGALTDWMLLEARARIHNMYTGDLTIWAAALTDQWAQLPHRRYLIHSAATRPRPGRRANRIVDYLEPRLANAASHGTVIVVDGATAAAICPRLADQLAAHNQDGDIHVGTGYVDITDDTDTVIATAIRLINDGHTTRDAIDTARSLHI